ncbi:helix-turn-helix domain-containing protein [Dendronalium sp. ChiSLP03b]|uniref:winged helix-turn-helix transcriptional regulator n=1 Tax=Dendronalium sp. ChiSLP03b TaxID=3075381 RepID=UPI002AD54033|nr:helix-turn-helix domain-containing protein [Dendronalium sp. ChiSLP03b]MDZ8208796.1 helix-turn-helix domain-containing protein [Dendronalium sp. ChiSLP03b]
MIRDFPEPDLFTLNCPTQQILDVIADKWSVIVLYCLAYRSRRYNDIQRRIEGISQKVLTQTLRKLEKHGLVERKVLSQMPLSVEYSLTSLGETLIEPLLGLASWTRQHFSEVVISRNHYDQQNLG